MTKFDQNCMFVLNARMGFTKELARALCKKKKITAVRNVRGLSANSCSPSDQWVLQANTSLGRKKLFMKVFMHVDRRMHDDVQKACRALEYERQVYENILPRTQNTYFPIFWKAETRISFDDMLDFLTGRVMVKGRALTRSELDARLLRNLKYMFTYDTNRPCLQSSQLVLSKDDLDTYAFLRKVRLQYILLESFPPNFQTLYHMLSSKRLQNEREFWTVMHQTTCAIEVLDRARLQHNDLHYDNIVLHKKKCVYYRKNRRYTCPYKVFIFDFDRAFHADLGENSINDDYFEENYGIFNEFTSLSDYVYLVQCISAIMGNTGILRMLCTSAEKHDEVESLFTTFVESEQSTYRLPNLTRLFCDFDHLVHNMERYMKFRNIKHVVP